MKVEITKSEIDPGWRGFVVTDDNGDHIILPRPAAVSLTSLLQSVLNLEQEVALFSNLHVEAINAGLLESVKYFVGMVESGEVPIREELKLAEARITRAEEVHL